MGAKYNRAVYRTIIHWDGFDKIEPIEEASRMCNELILVIPDKWLYSRIFGGDEACKPEHLKQLWGSYPFISDVVVIDREHMTLAELRELVSFDAVFVGNEYGINYLEDLEYCNKSNIELISLAPDRFIKESGPNALELALKNVPKTKKIICFGTGVYFDKFMEFFGKKHAPAYAIDNDSSKWGTMKNGVYIYDPKVLQKENLNDVLVIFCAKNYKEQKDQLLAMGSYNYRSMIFYNDIALLEELLITVREEKAYMDKASVILNKLMEEFDKVCRKYNLRYYVISGSLIGVVRHQGMIPWDDDIDVGMPREDIEKLKEIADKEWNGEEFLFVDYCNLGNNAFHDLMPRLFYMKEKLPTMIMDKSRDKIDRDLADRLILDIYPMDNASDNLLKHRFNMMRIKLLYNLLMGHRGYIDYEEYSKLPQKIVMLIKLVNKIGRCLPFKLLVWLMDKAIKCENGKNTQCYYMSSGPIYYVERTYKKEYFGEGQLKDFNKMKVQVPLDYDGLLKSQNYGNYMNLPPYAMRKPSHYFNADISIW